MSSLADEFVVLQREHVFLRVVAQFNHLAGHASREGGEHDDVDEGLQRCERNLVNLVIQSVIVSALHHGVGVGGVGLDELPSAAAFREVVPQDVV